MVDVVGAWRLRGLAGRGRVRWAGLRVWGVAGGRGGDLLGRGKVGWAGLRVWDRGVADAAGRDVGRDL